MEYLTINGEVKVIEPNNIKLNKLLNKLKGIKFEDNLSIEIDVVDSRLSMGGEGEMSTANINEIVMLLNDIDHYTSSQSYFMINRSRWEAMIKLKSSQSAASHLTLAA